MKTKFVLTVAIALSAMSGAQDQSACPAPRHDMPVNTCAAGGNTKREITVRVANVHVDPGKFGAEVMVELPRKLTGDNIEPVTWGLR
jgi:hypothetical protein